MRLPHRRKQVPPPQGGTDRGTEPATEPGTERETYPYDPEHPDRPYEQVQRDIGTSLLLGAVVLVVLVGLLALGLA
ncbi:MAG TPA: hypothetical protein VFK66_08445 [Oryzihumus sp.]|nr:hypothetical protein [Oryzihumus sp.]